MQIFFHIYYVLTFKHHTCIKSNTEHDFKIPVKNRKMDLIATVSDSTLRRESQS